MAHNLDIVQSHAKPKCPSCPLSEAADAGPVATKAQAR